MCTAMFTAVLFAIAKIWKLPKFPSADEWIKKIQCIMYQYVHTHTMDMGDESVVN